MVQRLHDYQIVWDSQSWKRQSSVSDHSLLIYNVKVCLRHMQCYKNDDLNFHLDSSHRMQIFNFNWKLKLIFEHVSHQSSPASSDFSFAERRSSIFDPDYFRIGSWEAMMTMVVVINWLRRLMWLSFTSNGCFPRLVQIYISVCTTSCSSFQQSLVQAVAWLQVQSVSRLAMTHIKGSP